MTVHYKYGGSSAARLLQCQYWPQAAERLPSAPSSIHAQTGTALHTCMERILEGDIAEFSEVLGTEVDGVVITADHLELLTMALMAWDAFCREYQITDYETEITSAIRSDTGGTTDVKCWGAEWAGNVDWKFGQGVKVSAKKSAQNMFYAMCGEHGDKEWLKDRRLVSAIIQPMPSRESDTLDVWEVPPAEYTMFKMAHDSARDAAEVAGPKTPISGSACTFCPVEAICPLKTGELHKANAMHPDDLAKLAENTDLAFKLEKTLASVKKLAHERLEAGDDITGFKLVEKQKRKKYTDEDGLISYLSKKRKVKKHEYLTTKLLTPAQLLKLFKSHDVDTTEIDAHIINTSSGSTLVRESDKREAVLSPQALQEALERL